MSSPIYAYDKILNLEKNQDLGFISEDEIDEEKLKAFVANATPENYESLKEELGIRGDFCIFYEDVEGNIILIENRTGIGHSAVLIDGYECGEDIFSP